MKEQNRNNYVYGKNQLQNQEILKDLSKDEIEKRKKYMKSLCNLGPNPNINVIGPAGRGHNFKMKDYLQN